MKTKSIRFNGTRAEAEHFAAFLRNRGSKVEEVYCSILGAEYFIVVREG